MSTFIFESNSALSLQSVVDELGGGHWTDFNAGIVGRGDRTLTLQLPSDGAALKLAAPLIISDSSFSVSPSDSQIVTGRRWEDWTSVVGEPESLEVSNEALPTGGLTEDELALAEFWIVRWDWGWHWEPASASFDNGPSADPPSGVEGFGRWIWGAVRFVWRTAGRVALDDPRVYAGIKVAEYAGKRAYRAYKEERVRARRQYQANELNRRLVLQAARERSARTTQGSYAERAQWREYYSRVDRMIEASR